jgi:multimeric flavodoxin WrbA
MERNGVPVEVVRTVDPDIATGVWPDMTEYGWERDEWLAVFEKVIAADILVLTSTIWLGQKSSVCMRLIERLYGNIRPCSTTRVSTRTTSASAAA